MPQLSVYVSSNRSASRFVDCALPRPNHFLYCYFTDSNLLSGTFPAEDASVLSKLTSLEVCKFLDLMLPILCVTRIATLLSCTVIENLCNKQSFAFSRLPRFDAFTCCHTDENFLTGTLPIEALSTLSNLKILKLGQ